MLALTPQENLIRLAAFIDGEGMLSIIRYNRKWITYSPIIRIMNTKLELMEWLVSTFGGSYYKQKIYKPNHKQGYVWTAPQVYKLLNQIYPFLLLKRSQAAIILSFETICPKTPYKFGWTPEKLKLAESFKAQLKFANKRGV